MTTLVRLILSHVLLSVHRPVAGQVFPGFHAFRNSVILDWRYIKIFIIVLFN